MRMIRSTKATTGAGGYALAVLITSVVGSSGPRSSALGGYTAVHLYRLGFPPGGTEYGMIELEYEAVAAGQVAGTVRVQDGSFHAALWQPNGAAIDLNPAGFINSDGFATDGTHQVGSASNVPNSQHAILWSGSAASAVDLNPTNLPGLTISEALGVGGGQQVGYGTTADRHDLQHALLWNGSANSAVDLSPAGFTTAFASGTDGSRQVGAGYGPATGNQYHALLWSGTAASVIDLNPPGVSGSQAEAISGTQIVGGSGHALLWTGVAVVDLNPTALGATFSDAHDTNGKQQVGYANIAGGFRHAVVWSGTADSAVDLGALLPPELPDSQAFSIDAAGNVFGIATDNSTRYDAIEWVAPEPSSFLMVTSPLVLCWRRRRAS